MKSNYVEEEEEEEGGKGREALLVVKHPALKIAVPFSQRPFEAVHSRTVQVHKGH